MPEKFTTLPADGGSYRKNKDGTFTRLDKPQTPDPGKSARKEAAEKAKAASASKSSNKE
jgi:hypothetical protein